jgi:hypothetical protein
MRFFRLVRPLKSLTHFRTLRLVIDTFIASRVSIATVGTALIAVIAAVIAAGSGHRRR